MEYDKGRRESRRNGRKGEDKFMNKDVMPPAWNEFSSRLNYCPVVVKSLEKIHDTSWSMEQNIHDHFEMVYIKRGSAIFQINDIFVPLDPNCIVIIKPQQWHKFQVKSKTCEFIVLSFYLPKHTDAQPEDVASLTDFINSMESMERERFITLKLGPKNDIIGTMRRILYEREKKEEWNDFLTYLLVMELFVLLSRTIKQEWQQTTRNRSMNLKESLQSAKEYIDNNYNRDISLSDVARYIYISDSYFAHSFKNQFHISPKNYILRTRVEAAKDMLKNTDMKVSDIAIAVGFSSQQRFNDIFKKTTGVTPIKFKKKWKETLVNKVE